MLDDNPGELPGYGPVIADIARQTAAQLATTATWRFEVLDHHGSTLAEGILGPAARTTITGLVNRTGYRPTAAQDAYVKTRDKTCRAPAAPDPRTAATSTTPAIGSAAKTAPSGTCASCVDNATAPNTSPTSISRRLRSGIIKSVAADHTAWTGKHPAATATPSPTTTPPNPATSNANSPPPSPATPPRANSASDPQRAVSTGP
jgi:hypothetical protein